MQVSNMVMFDRNRRLKKYKNVAEILEEFYHIRLEFYEKRKEYLISRLERELMILDNKKKFIIGVIEDEIVIKNVKKRVICDVLKAKGFTQMKDIKKIKSTKVATGGESKKDELEEEVEPEDQKETGETANLIKQYNYLLNMNLWSLSYEKVQNLIDEFDRKSKELVEIKNTDSKTMWEKDIEALIAILDEVEEEEERERLNAPKVKGNGNH
jgi:DNA topoisomerase-2